MESTLMFFLIGLSVFAVKRLTAERSDGWRLLCFVAAGTGGGALVAYLAGHPLSPAVNYPAWLVVPTGAFAGWLCFWAESRSLLNRPGIQYLATLLLGLITAAFTWGAAQVYRLFADLEVQMTLSGGEAAIIWITVGFVTLFGYTFPERLFKPPVRSTD